MRRLILLATVICAAGFAQENPPPGGGAKGRGAMGPPKNLQILKPDEVMATMRGFALGLGVKCNTCHVQGDFSSDDKHEKVVARQMLTMVRAINANYFNGNERVTCYTCHRGSEHPKTVPDAGTPGETRPPGQGGPPSAPPPAN